MDVLPDDLLHVGADGGRRLDHLVHQELVQDGRFAGVVQPDDADFVFCKTNRLDSYILQVTGDKLLILQGLSSEWHWIKIGQPCTVVW